MVELIHRSKLEPHPDNPRKDLGDLTELAASIQRSGLLQNLTVVPHPDKPDMYRIIIGHRRFAASELAGLEELPCAIEDMSPADQVATMLAENMQRNDLTISDQVSGVQTMLDLGENAVGISVKTGLSTTTIRKREKLAKLDFAKLKAAEQRGATLLKFMEVEEIEDAEQRDRALDALGTPEYSRVMWDIKAEILRKRILPQLIETVERYAKRIDKENYSTDIYVDYFGCHDEGLEKAKAFKGKGEFVFTVSDAGSINLYRKRAVEETEAEAKKREEREHAKAQAAEERELRKKFDALRREYLRDLNCAHLEKTIMRFAVWVMTRQKYMVSPTKEGLLYGMMPNDPDAPNSYSVNPSISDIESATEKGCSAEKAILFGSYDRLSSEGIELMDSYGGYYKGSEIVSDLYHYMEALGYEPCDEERQWLDGSHPVYEGKRK